MGARSLSPNGFVLKASPVTAHRIPQAMLINPYMVIWALKSILVIVKCILMKSYMVSL